MNEMGNQSRVGSPMPVWFWTSCARCERGVTLRHAALIGDILVTSGEADRLEREEVDLLRVLEREIDDAANLLVIDAVDDAGNGDDVDASLVEIVDGLELPRRTRYRPCRRELAAPPTPSNCR